MRSFTYSIHVDRTPQQVWDYMLDFEKAPRWRNLVRAIEIMTPGPLAAGSRLNVTLQVGGTLRTLASEVCAFEPPRLYAVRNTEQGLTGTFEYRLAPEGSGTRVSFTCRISARGLMWLMVPFVIPGNRRRYAEQLPKLKAELERDRIEPWNTSASVRPA